MWVLIGHATCAHAGCRTLMHKGGTDPTEVSKHNFNTSKENSLPGVVGLILSLSPSQRERNKKPYSPPLSVLHPAEVRKVRRGGEEESGGRRESQKLRAWRAVMFKKKSGGEEGSDGVGYGEE